RLDVEAHAVPLVAFQIDPEPAVGGGAPDIAGYIAERHAAILRAKFGGASEIVDGNSAVVRLQGEHGRARHLDFEADRPVVVARVGAIRAHSPTCCVDAHARDHAARLSLGVGVAHDLGAHEHVAAIRSAHADPAV